MSKTHKWKPKHKPKNKTKTKNKKKKTKKVYSKKDFYSGDGMLTTILGT